MNRCGSPREIGGEVSQLLRKVNPLADASAGFSNQAPRDPLKQSVNDHQRGGFEAAFNDKSIASLNIL